MFSRLLNVRLIRIQNLQRSIDITARHRERHPSLSRAVSAVEVIDKAPDLTPLFASIMNVPKLKAFPAI